MPEETPGDSVDVIIGYGGTLVVISLALDSHVFEAVLASEKSVAQSAGQPRVRDVRQDPPIRFWDNDLLPGVLLEG